MYAPQSYSVRFQRDSNVWFNFNTLRWTIGHPMHIYSYQLDATATLPPPPPSTYPNIWNNTTHTYTHKSSDTKCTTIATADISTAYLYFARYSHNYKLCLRPGQARVFRYRRRSTTTTTTLAPTSSEKKQRKSTHIAGARVCTRSRYYTFYINSQFIYRNASHQMFSPRAGSPCNNVFNNNGFQKWPVRIFFINIHLYFFPALGCACVCVCAHVHCRF